MNLRSVVVSFSPTTLTKAHLAFDMTDAHIPPKNNTNREYIETFKEKTNTTNHGHQAVTLSQQNASNGTTDSNVYQNQDTKLAKDSQIKNCTKDPKTLKCNATQFLDSDTVLKYVYKTDDKLNISEKTKGHAKNSLKRRKRFANTSRKSESFAESAPLIVNYETQHPPNDREHLSQINTANLIRGSDLADFNIETLHDHPNKNNAEHRKDYSEVKEHPKSRKESEESDEKEEFDDNRKNKKTYRESDESEERSDYRDSGRNPQGRELDSNESDEKINEKATHPTSVEDSSDSGESEESSYKKSVNSRESQESLENKDSKSAYRDVEDDSKESSEKDFKDIKSPYKSEHAVSPDSRERNFYRKNTENNYNRADIKSAYKNPRDDSTESREKDAYKEGEKPSYLNERTTDLDSRENDDSRNSGETSYVKPNEKFYDNGEESKEKDYFKDDEKLTDKKDHLAGPDSTEKDYYKNNDKSILQQPTESNNESEEEEEIIAIMKKKNRKPHAHQRNDYKSGGKDTSSVNSPASIRDIDIGDFSYERIQVNDKGIVEPVKDTNENYDTGSLLDIAPVTTLKPKINHGNEKYSIESADTPLRDEINEEIQKHTHINDGEVKPVVEINSNGESNEKAFTTNSNNEDTSLESLLGVKETSSDEQNEKIVEQDDEQKGDVKQQFERIPLNYKHDINEQKQNGNEPESPESSSEADSHDGKHNGGTLDVLMPKDYRYDENLNIKFNDLTIKLPEIKLPKDILAYTHEEPNKPNEDKQKFFHYSGEYDDEYDQAEKKKKDEKQDEGDHYDDFDHGYYGDHKKKNDYTEKNKKSDDEDQDEDLYEKFVRERFGKRGSFEKRSGKLREMRPIEQDSELFTTLKQVLKKTENIHKQAEKSGDPNAGYMWTLEYGQKL